MVDFSALLRKPAFEAKKPTVLPVGDRYRGRIRKHELTEKTIKDEKVPCVRLSIAIVEWDEGVEEAYREGIDLSKRVMSRDYTYNPKNPGHDDQLYMLDRLMRSCGIEGAGRGYDELLPELHGQDVTVQILQYMNQRNSELGNNIGTLAGDVEVDAA